MTSAGLVGGATFGKWNWIEVRPRLLQSLGHAQCIPSHPINYWRPVMTADSPPIVNADTHLKQLDREVMGAWFQTGGVFEWDIAHRRSVAVLCELNNFSCNPVHPLNCALPGPKVPVRVSGCTSAYLCAASLQNIAVWQDVYSHLSVPLERTFWPRIRWCETGGFQEQGKCFFIGLRCSIPTMVFYYFSISLLSLYVGIVGLGSSGWYGVYHSLSALHCRPILIITIIWKLAWFLAINGLIKLDEHIYKFAKSEFLFNFVSECVCFS